MTVKYRALVPGGYYSSTPFDRRIPVSIRCNNPGAINGAAWERSFPGYVDTVETTPGNKTTIFEAPEFGVAVWWELLRRYSKRDIDTLSGIIREYGGGQDYSAYVAFVAAQTGFSPRKKISLDDAGVLIPFGRAMFRYEAGEECRLRNEQIEYGIGLGHAKGLVGDAGPVPDLAMSLETTVLPAPAQPVAAMTRAPGALTLNSVAGVQAIQTALTRSGYLDPPADGGFGPVTRWALESFAKHNDIPYDGTFTPVLGEALHAGDELPLYPGDDLAGRITRAMLRNGYWIARHPECVTIVYVEGLDPDGEANDNRNNVFNDLRTTIRVREDGVPEIVGMWEATTEPSRKWTRTPMDPDGAFHIKFGQYKAWTKGWYHTHEALRQTGEIEGYRDPHKTFKRDLNYPVKGSEFGVHHHWGYDLPHGDMGSSSAGCLVGRSTSGHREFLSIVLRDPRYLANSNYRFMAAILPAGDLAD